MRRVIELAYQRSQVLIRGEISTDGPIQPLNNDEAHVDGSNTYAPVYQQPINSPHPHHLKENPPPAHKAQPRAIISESTAEILTDYLPSPLMRMRLSQMQRKMMAIRQR